MNTIWMKKGFDFNLVTLFRKRLGLYSFTCKTILFYVNSVFFDIKSLQWFECVQK